MTSLCTASRCDRRDRVIARDDPDRCMEVTFPKKKTEEKHKLKHPLGSGFPTQNRDLPSSDDACRDGKDQAHLHRSANATWLSPPRDDAFRQA